MHHQVCPSLWLRAGSRQDGLLNTSYAPGGLLGTSHASASSPSLLGRSVIMPTERTSPGRCPDLPKQRLVSQEAGEVGKAQCTKVLEYILSWHWEPLQVLDREAT